ncbi:MAG: type II secretion system ATPase GspE [Bdellovibrionales bacterium]|nr:type II secretion system ATPase GspE [Bdellovibrionales bacterium]
MDMNSYESLILKNSTLSKAQLRTILSSKNKKGVSLQQALEKQKKSFSSGEEALSFLCQHLQVPFIKEVPVQEIADELIQHFPISYAKANMVLPFKVEGHKIHILSANPLNFQVFSDLKLKFKKEVRPVVSLGSKVQEAINSVYERSSGELDEFADISKEDYDLESTVIDLLDADDSAPVIKLVNTLLFKAVKERASDIHIEPYEKELVVRFRVDGALYSIFKPPKSLQNAIISRIKIMGDLNIAEKRLPQDGRIHLRLAGKDVDIRLSSIPTAFGERLVLRMQDRTQVVLELDELGFSTQNLKNFNALLDKNYGIILITGPTGSGKSTTLYAALNQINSIDQNIITVEDPVERRIKGIGQIQVNSKIGLTFANGLRSILRQDPDTIMVGEIRDIETMKIAINASLTGHLVLSTIHTNDSASVFPRLIDMGGEPFLIATSILGVMAQRLVRVLCQDCRQSYKPTKKDVAFLNSENKDMKIPSKIFKAKGCKNCEFKGYVGRTMIQEILVTDEDIRVLVMNHKDSHSIKKKALKKGMVTFRQNGIEKICKGITTIEEVVYNTQLDA